MAPSVSDDIINTHEEMIMAACIQGIVETTKKMPTEDEVIMHLGKVVHDNGVIDYVWKGTVIIRAHAPQFISDKDGRKVIHRKLEQVWQKGNKGFH